MIQNFSHLVHALGFITNVCLDFLNYYQLQSIDVWETTSEVGKIACPIDGELGWRILVPERMEDQLLIWIQDMTGRATL
jgi:hypothetical protein